MTKSQIIELEQEIDNCRRTIESCQATILIIAKHNPAVQIMLDAIETQAHIEGENLYRLRELEKAAADDEGDEIFSSPVEGVRNAQD